jgi:hypothetical protein
LDVVVMMVISMMVVMVNAGKDRNVGKNGGQWDVQKVRIHLTHIFPLHAAQGVCAIFLPERE